MARKKQGLPSDRRETSLRLCFCRLYPPIGFIPLHPQVELATVSFGQSFQITPVQLITTAASIVNGGNRVTPHFGVETVSADGTSVHKLDYPSGGRILSEETSATMRYVLEQVVSEGSGKKRCV